MTIKTNVNLGVGPNWCLAKVLNRLWYHPNINIITLQDERLGIVIMGGDIIVRNLVDDNGEPLLFKDQSTETQEAINAIILSKSTND